MWHVSRWPAASPAGRAIGEKKETLMLFPFYTCSLILVFLLSFAFTARYFIPLHSSASLLFSSLPKVSHFRVCAPFIFITLTFLTRWFSLCLFTPELCSSIFTCFLFFYFLKLYFLTMLVLFFILYSCLLLFSFYISIPAFCLLILIFLF